MSGHRSIRIVAAVLLACSAVAVGGVAAGNGEAVDGSESTTNASLVSAYPNPVARGDPGEFVAVRFSEPTNTTGWTITDGKTTAGLPNRTAEGTVAFATSPSDARQHTSHPVAELDGRLLLADGGEELELRQADETVDTASYHNAPESRIRDFESNTWRPVGATEIEPIRSSRVETTAFVLPDAPDRTAKTLASADDRLYLGGYTLTSAAVTDALVEAHRNGAEVRVLLDGNPVGGMSERQARQLDRLTEAGVAVRLLSGAHTRYRHHHPKYAVVDERALVLTENFKPAGTGGMSSRGWGIEADDGALADGLATVHTADWEWRAATPWVDYRPGRDFTAADPALGDFETRHPPKTADVDSARLLVAPDNAADSLVENLDAAEERILVQQVDIDSRDNRLLRATLRAADRGVTVRIHLSGAWYVEDENADLAAWLNRRADTEDWDLQARVDDAAGYERIHTKGVIVDDTAVVGSLNWGRAAKSDNREVLLELEGESVAGYYAEVFADDWSEGRSGSRSIPAGLLGAVAVALSGVLLLARRIEAVGRAGVVDDWQW